MRIVRNVAKAVILLFCAVVADFGMEDSPEKLTAKSDAVVVGTVVSGTVSRDGAFFYLRVDRVLKGAVCKGQILATSRRHRDRVFGSSSIAGAHGLFFLAKEEASWRLVPVLSGHTPFPGTYYPLSKMSAKQASSETWIRGDSVIEKIVSELSASIDQCERGKFDHLVGEGLMRIEDKSLQRRVKNKLSPSNCAESNALAAALAVNTGEPGAWTQLAGHIHDIKNTQFIGIVLSLAHSCRGASPDDVRALGRLATSDIQGLNSSATRALEAIHTREAVPFLAELLSSPDAQIRLKAIRGLSMFVDSLPVMTADAAQSLAYLQPPGKGLYRTTETDRFSASRRLPAAEKAPSYVEFWKKWWESVKGEFGN